MQKSKIKNPKSKQGIFYYLIVLTLLGFGILSLGFMINGCGLRTETTSYYYSPSWTRLGTIIFVGETSSVSRDILGSQISATSSRFVQTIYPSGTGESQSLFSATDAVPYVMTSCPTAEYLAYGDTLRSGLYRKVVIRNISTSTHAGLETVELAFNPGIKSFDWSDDGTQLVYCTSDEVRTIDIDGFNDSLVVADSNIEFVSWRYGTRIAFVRTSGSDKILSLINANGTGRINMTAAASVDLPQISATNTNEVFGIAGGSLAKVDVSAVTPATTEVKASFTGELPRLSPDATKVTYSKSGETTGVYSLEIATGTETEVK
ncbi:MAG: hypothetical protein ABIA67_00135 [Candidatus Margulisiibacteriota bacterium]